MYTKSYKLELICWTDTCLTEQSVVEEPETLVGVGQDPGVGVDVEAVDHLNGNSDC